MKFSELHINDPPYTPSKDVQGNLITINDIELLDSLDADLLTDVVLAANYVDNQRMIDACLLYIHYKTRFMVCLYNNKLMSMCMLCRIQMN